jgi:hypothetical protein
LRGQARGFRDLINARNFPCAAATRRDIAETIRCTPDAENPSYDDLAEFRAYMNPPDVETPGGVMGS